MPQSCLTMDMFVQWYDKHEMAGVRGHNLLQQAERLSNKVPCSMSTPLFIVFLLMG